MNRKSILLALISALIIIGGIVIFLVFGVQKKVTSDALRAIPIDAALVVKINDLEIGRAHV